MALSAPAVAFLVPAATPTSLTAAPTSASRALNSATQTQWSPSLALPVVAAGAAALAGARCKKVRDARAARASGPQKAIPFLPAPQYWDWAQGVPGDNGFDPLDFWKGKDMGSFANQDLDMRDAEIKHSRLAMLAAVHWPMAELFHRQIAESLGLPNKLAESGLNPSLLNGSLNDPTLQGFLLLAAFGAAVTDLSKVKGTEPGDYGFDPLNLRNAEPPILPSIFKLGDGRAWMAESEIVHGRLAMVAIAAFAAQEKLSHVPIVLETPQIFGTA